MKIKIEIKEGNIKHIYNISKIIHGLSSIKQNLTY